MLDNYYTFRALDLARERREEADRHRLALLAIEGRPAQRNLLDRLVDVIASGIASVAGTSRSTNETSRATPALSDRPTARQ